MNKLNKYELIFTVQSFKFKLFWHRGFSFQHILQVYLNICSIFQQVCECMMQNKQILLLHKLLTNLHTPV